MNIIFLDFDGVTTTPNSEYTPILERIELIRYILDATDSMIVLSSSWRPHRERYGHCNKDCSQEEIIEYIRKNPYYNIHLSILFLYIIGCTPHAGKPRGVK